jgi:hypothetical protein
MTQSFKATDKKHVTGLEPACLHHTSTIPTTLLPKTHINENRKHQQEADIRKVTH